MHRSKTVFCLAAALSIALAGGRSSALTYETLASFNSVNGKSPSPQSTLILSGSTLYGTTNVGGPDNDGSVFSVPVTGGTPTTLATFNGTNGQHPTGVLAISADGSTLYGTALNAGANSVGTIFSVPVTGGTPTVLANMNVTDGSLPVGVALDGSTLYGMANQGGTSNQGTVFSLPASGGTPTVLTSFEGTDGRYPNPNNTLTLIGSTLYGMTNSGGATPYGTVFSLPIGGGTPNVLGTFNYADGEGPLGSLTLVGSTFYGTCSVGGASGDGTIFSIPITGGTPTLLAAFNRTDGEDPMGDLTLVGSTLYGLTSQGGAFGFGTLFSIPLTGGTPTVLMSFSNFTAYPMGSLTASGSTLYGTTSGGGAYGFGSVFAFVLPEPSSSALFGMGAIGLAVTALRRRVRKHVV